MPKQQKYDKQECFCRAKCMFTRSFEIVKITFVIFKSIPKHNFNQSKLI